MVSRRGVCQNLLVPALDAGTQKDRPSQSDFYRVGFNAIPRQAREQDSFDTPSMKIKFALPDSMGRAEPCPYKRQLFCMAVSSKSHTDKSLFTSMNLYREKQPLHFWNHPCGDIGGIIIRI